MAISTIVFLIMCFGALIGSFLLDGGHLTALIALAPAIIVFGGTIGAVGVSFPGNEIKNIGKVLKVALSDRKVNTISLIRYFKNIAFKTRKEGLLSIEEMISADKDMDPFMKKGLQMVVDGIDPQTVKNTLELSADLIEERHRVGIAMLEAAGGFAPTMGITGTVTGLVHVLNNLSDPTQLGGLIAGAFIATLYGIGSANFIWLPLGTKLKELNFQEMLEKNLIIEAILCIQEGVNPNTLEEKLKGFLDKKQLEEYNQGESGEQEQ
ncbi:motility protein A [Clostridium pasteurianum]|uniref:motility protein A n=1 Tax=Clostridium pasteurianum TaxID=1501 RepID=UPI002260E8EC|nr:motility protein A [Clostridium pasteurianum]UZW14408.1 motility protein A [Clostridium pasteurianum]